MSQSSAGPNPEHSAVSSHSNNEKVTWYKPDVIVDIVVQVRFDDDSRSVDKVFTRMTRYPDQSRCGYECMQPERGPFKMRSEGSWVPDKPLTLTLHEYKTLKEGVPTPELITLATRLGNLYYQDGVGRILQREIQAPRGVGKGTCQSDLLQHSVAMIDRRQSDKIDDITGPELLAYTQTGLKKRKVHSGIIPSTDQSRKTHFQMYGCLSSNWPNEESQEEFLVDDDAPTCYTQRRGDPELERILEAPPEATSTPLGDAGTTPSDDLASTARTREPSHALTFRPREPSQVSAADHPEEDVDWADITQNSDYNCEKNRAPQ